MSTSSPPPSTGEDLVISGIGVVTPWADTPVAAAAATGRPSEPGDWFDHRERLGRRGYKYLPTATQYFLAAAKHALADAGETRPESDPEDEQRRGAMVGTNSAAVALHESMDHTVMAEGANALSPATAPYFSINLFGSRLATEHVFRAFNLTLTSPRVAGLEALETGARSIAAGRASWLLAGATEEALPAGHPGADVSERGAVALVMEPVAKVRERGTAGYGRCRVRSFFLPPEVAASPEGPDRVRERIAAVLAGQGMGPGQEHRVIAVLDDSPVSAAVAVAVGPRADLVTAGAGALEPLLQVAGALAELSGPVVVVTAAREGNLAVALLTPPDDVV
ncbi:beta-ketoacyl synthase N-terminal-like domain-containing protein [Streptomyces sp. CA-278952]|uniref:beta-ketoacyl synthase N-terminal-like domain-containing protein n=1 Tax=unclassified Streptomyces TaxID=2593676 RepID=UPI002367D29F|nr:beta-ketoacyl synthase N-terminal-like domain-containing protein [Streptomyces sp. CA-278952]WDG27635.1 beta-ketoacyl synthase N-terminal-like domain-containing protein [Streptomyces sp. CA-278952]